MDNIQVTDTRELRDHYLFAALSEAQRRTIYARTRMRPFTAGQRIFNQGDDARAFFLLLHGAVKLYRVSALGQEKIMRLARGGDSFAESVMFMDEPRYPVAAEGVEAGMLASIETAVYLEVLSESFAACRGVMTQMTRRIQNHWDEIEALTLQNSRYRVVHYLHALAPAGASGEVRVTLPLRKALIATQLAMAPETLSRILNGLGEQGLIEMHEYAVRIPDIAVLQRLQ